MLGQDLGITLPGEDGVEDGESRDPHDVADDMMELKVHLVERVLEALSVSGGDVNEACAVTQERTQDADLSGWPKRAAQQADGVQVLEPLTVLNVGLAAWDVLHVPSVDKTHFDASGLEDLKQGNPVD